MIGTWKLEITCSFNEIAKKYGVSAFAITVAWHLATSPVSIPIPGATRIHSIMDTLKGVDIQLSKEDLEFLAASLPPLGPIHPELIDVDGL